MAGLTEMPKVGDEVRYLGGDESEHGNLTVGMAYEIVATDTDGDSYFYDDNDSMWFVCGESENLDYFELVAEPQPDVTELLANIGRRLLAVETELAIQEFVDTAETFVAEIDADSDAVNSPAHYKRGKFETIEVIEEITAGYSDGFVAHCAGTAIKYIARAPYKHDTPLEDLRKAERYLAFAIKRLEAKE